MPFSSPLIHTHYGQHIGNQVIASSCLKGAPLCLEIECEAERVFESDKNKTIGNATRTTYQFIHTTYSCS